MKSVQWGVQNEADAITQFQNHTGHNIQPCGLFLHTCGFLGASPDGIVNDNGLLEVKCPFRARNQLLEELAKNDKTFFLGFSDNFYLKFDHDYYHQVQGQLYICDKEICYFFVWSPAQSILLEIPKDPAWENNLDLLMKFYVDNLKQIAG